MGGGRGVFVVGGVGWVVWRGGGFVWGGGGGGGHSSVLTYSSGGKGLKLLVVSTGNSLTFVFRQVKFSVGVCVCVCVCVCICWKM